MTIAVDLGRKATKQTNKQTKDLAFNFLQDRICLQNSLGGGGGSKPILSHPSNMDVNTGMKLGFLDYL